MKYILILLIPLLLISCDDSYRRKFTRPFLIQGTENNNWTHSLEIQVDSFTWVSNNEMIVFIDGRSTNLYSRQFRIFSTENLK